MAKKPYKEPKDVKKNLMHIAFSENELVIIDDKRGRTTRSQFIRDAIDFHIKQMDNPELFMSKGSIDNTEITKFIEEIRTDRQETKKIFKKLNILSEIQKSLSALNMLVKDTEASKNSVAVDKVLKKHGGKCKITVLMKESKLNGLVYDVLSALPNRYSIDFDTNEVVLNE